MMAVRWLSLGLCLCLLGGPLLALGTEAEHAASVAAPEIPVLGWREIFKLPVGRRGLEPTDTLLRLRDQQVRVQGYMIKEEEPVAGLFMLTPTPVAMAELADGPADYLPAATLFVRVTGAYEQKILGYRPGLWTVSGTLRLGAQHEPNGRVSYVRLILDDPQVIRPPDDKPPLFLDRSALIHGHPH